MKTQEACIIVEQAFPHAPTKVWRAVVDVEQMGRWFFDDIPEFTREAGLAGWTYFIQGTSVRDAG